MDYEFLNKPNITQLIIAGDRCYDHQMRALLSGIPREKITTTMKNIDAWKYVRLDNVDKVFVLKNNFADHSSRVVFDEIVKKLQEVA
ncbi:MAG: DUF1727 domain-containing protein [Erysipelotrichaceae bacterium]|nr:DUF1727 domain-containing protein [Erysipelotrichaceae bacterium]